MNLPIPTPFEDEHVFSVIARYHRISANASVNETLKRLSIQSGQFMSQNIFNLTFHTSIIAAAVSLNEDPLAIAERHSIYPIYKLSMPKTLRLKWQHDWEEGNISATFEQEWIRDRTLKFDKSWRYCPSCIEADRNNLGIAYWHVQHQLPAIKLCHIHGDALRGKCTSCNQNNSTLNNLALPETLCQCDIKIDKIDLSWEKYMSKTYKGLKTDNQLCLEVTKQYIFDKWNLPKENHSEQRVIINNLLKKVEDFYGVPFLSEIFSYYGESTLFRERKLPDFVKNSLHQGSHQIRNPIFYLLLKYENLENRLSDFLGNKEQVKLQP